ncbi:hypothetical protein BGW38_006681 [Lunasporangiospora selenospora]|uniref:NADP-dependent oxidoreductase domain-containing protein n=1 Tax=Lunasporangiospora selenospora TaxID=979761 RepID=A0A9P6FML9_9FUNG|nr:hypothetical protein BGW38_006681 [Lunasporangiospora selenospora]
MNGKSEQLIGKVLANPRPNTLTRQELVVATKFGYIQNETMRLLSEDVFSASVLFKGFPVARIQCWPKGEDQLTRSLERMNTRYVDILFVHNPEYYLMANVKGSEANVKRHQTVMLDRLAFLFEALEREIEHGRIRSYGISSNSFALKPSHAHFLPYQDLVKMATGAFERVREQKQKEHEAYHENLSFHEKEALAHQDMTAASSNSSKAASQPQSHSSRLTAPKVPKPVQRSSHGLGFLQMPGNLLEMEGVLTTAKWAKSQELRVFVNRPLNAMSPTNGTVRLASYPEPKSPTYEGAKSDLLAKLSAVADQREHLQPKMQRVQEMLHGLDHSLKTNTLSAIHLDSLSVRTQIHQELAKPVKARPANAHRPQKDSETRADTSSTLPKQTQETKETPTSHSEKSSAPLRPSVHSIEDLLRSVDIFAHAFHQQVRSQETKRVEKMLTERGVDLEGESVERFAIEYLLEHAQVDSVLLGMKREPYVDFSRKILKDLAK